MRRHVSDDKDWEQVDDEDCWGVDYTEPTSQIREKMKAILHTWGEASGNYACIYMSFNIK